MIHVATVHHKSAKWIDLQLSYLRRHLHEPFRTVASLEGIDDVHHAKFDEVVPALGGHAGKLNLLATVICESAADDDLLMFLDGDAFPIADPVPAARSLLGSSVLAAVRRKEELGDRQPHPMYCVTTVGTWKRLRGDWSTAHPWTNDAGEVVTDVGGNLLFLLEQTGLPWSPIERTNRHDLHPVFYGIYGDVVYHHGAGFRKRYTRWDKLQASRPSRPSALMRAPVVGAVVKRVYRARTDLWDRRIDRRNEAVSEQVFRQAGADPEFFRQFL